MNFLDDCYIRYLILFINADSIHSWKSYLQLETENLWLVGGNQGARESHALMIRYYSGEGCTS